MKLLKMKNVTNISFQTLYQDKHAKKFMALALKLWILEQFYYENIDILHFRPKSVIQIAIKSTILKLGLPYFIMFVLI